MKKLAGILLAAAMLLLCGCTRGEQTPQAEPVTLRVMTSFGSGLRGLDRKFGVRWLRCVQRGMESPGSDGF